MVYVSMKPAHSFAQGGMPSALIRKFQPPVKVIDVCLFCGL